MGSVLGVDHVGIGVRNMASMKSFYSDVLGFTRVLGEMPEADHGAMRGLLRAPCAVHSAVLLGHEAGGLSVALFHATDPAPRPIRKEFRYGDIGVGKITMAVSDPDGLYRELGDAIDFSSGPKATAIAGWGEYRFVHGRDPEGNLIEFSSGLSPSAGKMFGGVRSIGISVTDLERSTEFYRRKLGFEKVVVASHIAFSGLVDDVSGSPGTEVRSCLLGCGKGEGMVEIFEVLRPRGRSIPFGAQWGDFGFLQVCLYRDDIDAMMAECEAEGIEVLLPPQVIDDEEHPGAFMNVRDPDGIPTEIAAFGA
jgi:catechol 2,3-dioxygenase-like lactoylglutathione lyase family enzyme